MKHMLLGCLLLCASVMSASPVTGNVAIAGASVYTQSGIQFPSDAFVLIGTGNFLPDVNTSFPMNGIVFSAPVGPVFTTGNDISMDLLTLLVVSNSANFLNIKGTATMTEPGFANALYDYTLTATSPDGVSSFTLTAIPAAAVPEPATLVLLSLGLFLLAFFLKIKGILQGR